MQRTLIHKCQLELCDVIDCSLKLLSCTVSTSVYMILNGWMLMRDVSSKDSSVNVGVDSRNVTAGQKDAGMLCNTIVPAPGSVGSLREVNINPQYFNYQTCSCESGFNTKSSSSAPQLE